VESNVLAATDRNSCTSAGRRDLEGGFESWKYGPAERCQLGKNAEPTREVQPRGAGVSPAPLWRGALSFVLPVPRSCADGAGSRSVSMLMACGGLLLPECAIDCRFSLIRLDYAPAWLLYPLRYSVSACVAGSSLFPVYASRFPACFPATCYLPLPRSFVTLLYNHEHVKERYRADVVEM
jgi:hypothetical protein